jgi:hypothetical protein
MAVWLPGRALGARERRSVSLAQRRYLTESHSVSARLVPFHGPIRNNVDLRMKRRLILRGLLQRDAIRTARQFARTKNFSPFSRLSSSICQRFPAGRNIQTWASWIARTPSMSAPSFRAALWNAFHQHVQACEEAV